MKAKISSFRTGRVCLIAGIVMLGVACQFFPLPNDVKEYLEQRAEPVSIDASVPQNIVSFDSYLYRSRVLLLGEHHSTANNFKLFLTLFKSLKNRGMPIQIVCELGYGCSRVINRYLRTGDETCLIYIMNNLLRTSIGNNEFFHFLKQFRILNEELPEGEKAYFWGIDIEHQVDLALFEVSLLVSENQTQMQPEGLAPLSELVSVLLDSRFNRSVYPSGHVERIKSFFYTLGGEIEKKEDEYRVFLGSHYQDFAWIVFGANASSTYFSEGQSDDFREEFMYKQFLGIHGKLSGDPLLLGLFGDAHTQKKSHRFVTIAQMLDSRSDSPVKNRVECMQLFYLDSFKMDRDSGAIEEINHSFQNQLREFSRGPATVFSLDEDGSPFREGCYLVFGQYRTGNWNTTDYFDLMAILTGSPACTLWRAQ